jgi:hypothetical protein
MCDMSVSPILDAILDAGDRIDLERHGLRSRPSHRNGSCGERQVASGGTAEHGTSVMEERALTTLLPTNELSSGVTERLDRSNLRRGQPVQRVQVDDLPSLMMRLR